MAFQSLSDELHALREFFTGCGDVVIAHQRQGMTNKQIIRNLKRLLARVREQANEVPALERNIRVERPPTETAP